MATRQPATDHGPATRWRLDDLGAALPQHRLQPSSRSSLWRILEAAALKPPRRVYWLTRHAPDFAAKAHALWPRSRHALRVSQAGRLVLGAEEPTGRQMLQRRAPTPPVQPGTPANRAHEYLRHGVRAFRTAFGVPTGPLVGNLGPPRTSADGAAHLAPVVHPLPAMQRDAWVVDHLPTHGSVDVGRLVAAWGALPCAPKPLEGGGQRRAFLSEPTHTQGCPCTPQHGAWRHQVAWWFRVLARRFLTRGDDDSPRDFATRLSAYLAVYTTPHAHPYRGTSTGQPVVRATPVRQTHRQQRQGRAWLRPRPQPFARACSPPRPYTRSPASLVANL